MNTFKNPYSLLLVIFMAYSLICSSQEVSNASPENIDSLIEVTKINKNTLQVKYGHDAVTAIKCSDSIVIIDAGISAALTSKYRKIIEKEFNTTNFKYLINTHGHFDHYMGNSVFLPARIVGHENCRREINDQWREPLKVKDRIATIIGILNKQLLSAKPGSDESKDFNAQINAYKYSYEDLKNNVKVKRPDIVFGDSLTLRAGNYSFEMFAFGTCHSESDILIYVPELKLLFSGDLFTKYGRLGNNKNLTFDRERYNQSIKWLTVRKPNIETIIGGHGQVMNVEDLETFMVKVLEI